MGKSPTDAARAEARGDLTLAFAAYEQAGDRVGMARIVALRAASANDDEKERLLRSALELAPSDTEIHKTIARALGEVLWRRTTARGIGLPEELARAAEAANLLCEGGAAEQAGQIFARIGDLERAADAYAAAGLIDETVAALNAADDDDQGGAARAAADATVLMATGQRTAALAAWERATRCSDDRLAAAAWRDLVARRLTKGCVTLRIGTKNLVITNRPRVVFGRDATATVVLRSGSVSREHIQMTRGSEIVVTDLGSRNGTLIGGLPLTGDLRLIGQGRIMLGAECGFDYRADETSIRLDCVEGRDTGLAVALTDEPVELDSFGGIGTVRFSDGIPVFTPGATGVALGNEPTHVPVELIVGDRLAFGHVTMEVA